MHLKSAKNIILVKMEKKKKIFIKRIKIRGHLWSEIGNMSIYLLTGINDTWGHLDHAEKIKTTRGGLPLSVP